MKRRIKINGLFLFIFTVISLAFHKLFSGNWRYEFLDEIFDVIGISFICLGFLLRISGRGHKSEVSKNGRQLVSDGPYSLVRNPMYLGIFMIGFGIILFLWKWWIIFIFVILFFIRFLPQIKREEKLLHANFTKDYELYCQKSPRLFPNLSLLWKEDIKEYLPLKYKWIKKELLSLITVIAIAFIFELHEDISHYGRYEYIKESILLINVVLYFILLFLFLLKRKKSM